MHRLLPTLLLLTGCADKDSADAALVACTDCAIEDHHNYTIRSEMAGDVVQLKALTDATIDWSELSEDVQGHPVAPGDVDKVLLVAFAEIPPADVMERLARDQLTQSEVAIYVICEPEGATSCALSEFGILSSTFDASEFFLPEVATWMVVPTTDGQQGGFSFLFLQASESATDSVAHIDNTTASLTAEVDLRSATPLALPLGHAEISLDWTNLATDGLGNPMEARTVDRLFVARYDQSLASLEDGVFDLEIDALEMWTLDLTGGTQASLGDLVGDRPFPGIDGQDTWLLALRCSTCTHPAPRFMSALVPGELP